ncbi:MAG: hypothetical protein CME06_15990 [Gemmatimonadetes bacterium]|nr:hypothetical protein [Gemmatimonadota bacterium]
MQSILYFKLLHIGGAFLWIGALINLCRLLAAMAGEQDESAKKGMVTLARGIYNKGAIPGILLTLIGGGAMLLVMGMPPGGWMHAKLLLVLFLVAADQVLRAKISSLASGQSMKTTFFSMMEIASILGLWAVLSLAVLRPF